MMFNSIYVCVSLSLSLSIHIYIYICIDLLLAPGLILLAVQPRHDRHFFELLTDEIICYVCLGFLICLC